MHHRGFGFGRFILFLLLIGGLIAFAGGRYRSGFQDGFVRGMAFTAVDGASGASAATPAVPPAYAGPWASGWGHGGSGFVGGGFPLGFGLLGFAFIAFMAMLFMGAMGRRCGPRCGPRHEWAGHGPHGPRSPHDRHGRHGRHGPYSPWDHHRGERPSDEVGPEKQPEDIA